MHLSYKDCQEKPDSNQKGQEGKKTTEMEGSISYLRKSGERERRLRHRQTIFFSLRYILYLNSEYDSSKKKRINNFFSSMRTFSEE